MVSSMQFHNNAMYKQSEHNVPMQSGSDINATLLLGPTSIQSFPNLTTGHDFLHSWRHFFGLHLSVLTMAIRICLSSPLSSFVTTFFFGGMFMLFQLITAGGCVLLRVGLSISANVIVATELLFCMDYCSSSTSFCSSKQARIDGDHQEQAGSPAC